MVKKPDCLKNVVGMNYLIIPVEMFEIFLRIEERSNTYASVQSMLESFEFNMHFLKTFNRIVKFPSDMKPVEHYTLSLNQDPPSALVSGKFTATPNADGSQTFIYEYHSFPKYLSAIKDVYESYKSGNKTIIEKLSGKLPKTEDITSFRCYRISPDTFIDDVNALNKKYDIPEQLWLKPKTPVKAKTPSPKIQSLPKPLPKKNIVTRAKDCVAGVCKRFSGNRKTNAKYH